MKEYGGFLPFELKKGNEYFDEWEAEFAVKRLNCGRGAYWYVASDSKPSKIYVPYLNCDDATAPFEQLGIDMEYYSLDDELLPQDVNPAENEAIVWINYYGNASEEKIDQVCKKYSHTNLIIDHCHSFFSKPRHHVYNCYSVRKFFGVCDGAYLIADHLAEIELEKADSLEWYQFVLESLEKGTNAVYSSNLENEKRLGCTFERQMSDLTRRVLQSIDYCEVKKIRNENMLVLHEYFKDINEFHVNTDSETHVAYPLKISNPMLRSKLIANKIYTPTWWRHVPEYFADNNTLECDLANYMHMIPIDQRYDVNDMKNIAETVLRLNEDRN